ncbi:hypothetical protein TNCV_2066731 [Trichonephila clavipes]|uniref:Transposase n=1 Tax=Trichonephila clavipes TaxID=2585209 RepID=A0A8X6W2F2_TRICX|nr:hypothetical protein TNCV_2066731 [Trichonephila clavipes]
MDFTILNHIQVRRANSDLAPLLQPTTPRQREDFDPLSNLAYICSSTQQELTLSVLYLLSIDKNNDAKLSHRSKHSTRPIYLYSHPLDPTSGCGKMRKSSMEQDARLCQVIYSQFGLAVHQNDHQARRRFVEWAQNEIAVVPDFHKRILFSDEAHFWLNGYVNKQNCRIWSEANPQVYVETPLHAEKLTVWCALWAGGILLQKR